MPTDASAAAGPSLSPEQQGAALWTFVHLKVPRFTSQAALEVLSELPAGVSEPKELAKYLRKALASKGVAIKHQAALGAAARVLGHESWHATHRSPGPAMFQLQDLTGETRVKESVADWRALGERISASLEGYVRRQDDARRMLRVSVSSSYLSVLAPTGRPLPMDHEPLLVVHPNLGGAQWRDGLLQLLEHLRRALEETGRAVLDGIAVARLCVLQSRNVAPDWPGFTATPENSGLVLRRFSTNVNRWIEIGRGDEVGCWSQLDLLAKADTVDTGMEEDGTWVVNQERYRWELQTLASLQTKPALELKPLPASESRRLLRRYQLAKRTNPGRLVPLAGARYRSYLRDTPTHVHVNLSALLEVMRNAGLGWNEYLSETGQDVQPATLLPGEFAQGLFERLDVRFPDPLLGEPPRSDLELVVEDSLLCSLLPSVSQVRHRVSISLTSDLSARVAHAVDEFKTSMNLMHLQEVGGLPETKGKELPYHVYSRAADTLRAELAQYGLCMYVGVAQSILRWPLSSEERASLKVSRYSISYALFLDIDRQDASNLGGKAPAGS